MTVSIRELAESRHNELALPTATPKPKRDGTFNQHVIGVVLSNDTGAGMTADQILKHLPEGTERLKVQWAANSAISQGKLKRMGLGLYGVKRRNVMAKKTKRRHKARVNGLAGTVAGVQAVAGARVGIPAIDKDLKRLDEALAALVTIEQTITKYRGLVQQIATLEKLLGK